MDMNGKRKKYTDRQIRFLRHGYLSMNIRDLTLAFNEQFGTSKTGLQIKSTLKNHRIRCGRKPGDRLIVRSRLHTEEQVQFIRENYAGRSVAEMVALFNEHFKTNRTWQQIKTLISNRGITSGRTGHFQAGNKPWNYGTKGQGLTGANSKSFKKGNVPPNRKPLWTERVCSKDGFILMKIPETNPYTGFSTRYKHKQVYIWEQEHGPVPKGMVVAFIDGDKSNCEPENLMLLSRFELLTLNKHGYKDMPDELKPYVLTLSKLQVKTWTIEANKKTP
jgi:hypothetical protein